MKQIFKICNSTSSKITKHNSTQSSSLTIPKLKCKKHFYVENYFPQQEVMFFSYCSIVSVKLFRKILQTAQEFELSAEGILKQTLGLKFEFLCVPEVLQFLLPSLVLRYISILIKKLCSKLKLPQISFN